MFRDRADAGRRLGARVRTLTLHRPVVIGLPRGGVPVARAVADALGAPLDVIVVRKLGVPGHEELGLGALAEDDVLVFNDAIREDTHVSPAALESVIAQQRAVLAERLASIRAVHPPTPLSGCTAVIVDDGIATGVDARAACRVARSRGASRVVLAVPVAPADWRQRLAGEADTFVALEEPEDFMAVGQYYEAFPQTSDDAVLAALHA